MRKPYNSRAGCVDVLPQLHLFLPSTHLVICEFCRRTDPNRIFCLRGEFRLLVENYSKRFNSSACNKHGEDSNVRGLLVCEEKFRDSDGAKHRTTRRSVSSGYLFLFGNLLYSSSRSQKALALSSCEAEVYAGTSATSDAVPMYHCICSCVGPNETLKVHLALDNSAGRSFFHRSGVGKIRHISLRVLWMQQKVREKFLTVGAVSTKCNPSDLGTKRMNRDRMLYLMFLCKVFDLSTSQYVGSEVNDRMEQESVTRKGIKLCTLAGMNTHDAKALMRVMLVSALSLKSQPSFCHFNDDGGQFELRQPFPCGDLHHPMHLSWLHHHVAP